MAERSDKLKNKAKVIKEVIKEPIQSQRQVADKAWIGLATANRILKELEQNGTESKILDDILGMDDNIIALSNWITLDIIKDKIANNKELSLNDIKLISELANNSTKRKAIFWNSGKDNDRDITIQI